MSQRFQNNQSMFKKGRFYGGEESQTENTAVIFGGQLSQEAHSYQDNADWRLIEAHQRSKSQELEQVEERHGPGSHLFGFVVVEDLFTDIEVKDNQ